MAVCRRRRRRRVVVPPRFVSRAGEKPNKRGQAGFAFQRGVAGTSCSTLNGIVARLNDAGSGEEIAFIQTPDLCVCVRAAAAAGGGAGDMMCCQSASLVSKQTAARQRSASVCAARRFSSQRNRNKWGGGTRFEWARWAIFANKTILFFCTFFYFFKV